MISAANINHGLTLAFILLISIILLIVAGVIGISSKKVDQKYSDTVSIVITILILVGMGGLLYSCAG